MTTSVNRVVLPPPFPDHTQLPESDGNFVKNFQEHPQRLVLTDLSGQILQNRHPDGQYAMVKTAAFTGEKLNRRRCRSS